MRKLISIVVTIPIVAWLLLWIAAASMERSVAMRPWPNGLGGLAQVPARYPERLAATPAAIALTRLTVPLGIDIAPREKNGPGVPRPDYDAANTALRGYLDAQLARPSSVIDPPPPALAAYLANHRDAIDAVRAHLLSGAPIGWKTQLSKGYDMPLPNLLGHMKLARLFVADALLKARANDAGAWDDLHALWLLDGGLRTRPELISQLISLAIARMTNAAAAKLPPSEPAWLGEVRAVDYRRSLVASLQSDAWLWMHVTSGGWVLRPYMRVCGADVAEHMRAALTDMANSHSCDVESDALGRAVERTLPKWNVFGRIAIPNIAASWQRATRATPELELTENVLQLRAGVIPSPFSRCSDGQWLVTSSSLKFSRTLPTAKTGINYPLEYAVLDLRH